MEIQKSVYLTMLYDRRSDGWVLSARNAFVMSIKI